MSRIVVGVDGSAGAAAALAWALEEGRLRRSAVDAVHAWRLPLYAAAPEPWFVGMPDLPHDLDAKVEAATEAHARDVLDAAVAAAEREAGDAAIEVRKEVVRGDAAHVLLEAARDADLLVVGSRGHGGFAGLLLGSVSQQCVQHASCPVVVVRAAAGADGGAG